MLAVAVLGASFGALLTWLIMRGTFAARVAALQATLDGERRHAGERQELLDRAESRLKDAFRAMSGEVLREHASSFIQLARGTLDEARTASSTELEGRQRAIGEMLVPIREALERVDGNLRQVEVARAGAYEALLVQVASLADTHKELDARTRSLGEALRSPIARGRWGEIQLRRVCEMAQMIEHVDFVEQSTVSGSDGMLRPDLKVLLPGGKVVIVDAKAPLQAYLDSAEAPDDGARDALLKQHAKHVRDHIVRLSARAYWEQFPETPEFVVMFLPGETFFSTALQYDPSLIEFGVERKIVPASPTTLIALLRAVGYGWQQERVSRGAEEVRGLGRELYDRLRVFATHLDDMRRGLEKAVDAYNRGVGSLEQNVLPQARRFRELGVAPSVELPTLDPIDRALREARRVEGAASTAGE